MTMLEKILGSSPFNQIVELARKVHECVQLIRPLTDAFIKSDYKEMESIHNQMSKAEHEADVLKSQIRTNLGKKYLLSVSKSDLMRIISLLDDVADSAEDFSVILIIRNTRFEPELKDDFNEFVDQVIKVAEHLLSLCQELSILAEASFSGVEAEKFLNSIEEIGQEEWKADRLQRKLAIHFYKLEDSLDPTTLAFYDKYCRALGDVANKAESAAKFIRQITLSR